MDNKIQEFKNESKLNYIYAFIITIVIFGIFII
jgi:hypothetical protein